MVVDSATHLLATWGLRALGALAILAIGRIVAGTFRSAVKKLLERTRTDETLVPFLSSIVYWGIMAFVIIAVLQLFGVPMTAAIASLGAMGLAVGLALQGTFSNVGAGVMLLLFRPFKIGDYVDAGGTAGTVQEIGLFSTTMNTPDHVRIVTPNSSIFGQTIRNYSANEIRRVDLVVGIAYGDDIATAVRTIDELVAADSRILEEPAPTIAVSELGDSSVNLVVRPWCRSEEYWQVRFDLTRNLKERLESAGCSIPFPQRDVHVFKHGETAA
jgi:small conductance mechanosensitive channel